MLFLLLYTAAVENEKTLLPALGGKKFIKEYERLCEEMSLTGAL